MNLFIVFQGITCVPEILFRFILDSIISWDPIKKFCSIFFIFLVRSVKYFYKASSCRFFSSSESDPPIKYPRQISSTDKCSGIDNCPSNHYCYADHFVWYHIEIKHFCLHLIAFSDFPKILINYPLNLKGHDFGSRLNKNAKCCKSHSSQNHWPFFSQQNALIFKILFCHDWSRDNDCEFYIIHGIGTGIGGHWLFDDFLHDPAKSSCQTKLSSELAMNMKLSMNRISCLISISSFVFFFVDVFANQDVYAKADVFFYITGNIFDISFIVITRFLMNKCES